MATEAQIAANRRNALKSTGPRTPEGKRRSSRNSVKWGLFSRQVILSEQDAAECTELSEHVRSLLQPSDRSEERLVDEVIANWFRLVRCLKIDGGLFCAYSTYKDRACGIGTAFAQAARLDCFGKLSRYEQHLERKLALSLQRFHSARRSRNQGIAPSNPEPPFEPPATPPATIPIAVQEPPSNRASALQALVAKFVTQWPSIWQAVVGKFLAKAPPARRQISATMPSNIRQTVISGPASENCWSARPPVLPRANPLCKY